jgi:hypothetical protein
VLLVLQIGLLGIPYLLTTLSRAARKRPAPAEPKSALAADGEALPKASPGKTRATSESTAP